MMRKSVIVLAVAMVLAGALRWSQAVKAASTVYIYGNNVGTTGIFKMDPTTLAVVDTYNGLSAGNGRGVVVVGPTVYYTDASSPNVYSYNATTHHNNGVVFTKSGVTGLSAIAYDGTNLWVNDYSGTNQAFYYSLTGTLLKTINLANESTYTDGFEFYLKGGTTPTLIANRADGCCTNPTIYDLYDLNGNVTTSAFITVPNQSTGIAYNGTNFYTSNIDLASVNQYNGATGAFISTTTITGGSAFIEDLSADYAIVLNNPPPTTPAPSTLGLVLGGMLLLLLGSKMFRRKQSAA
jgi:hypothetical protein